LSGWIFASKDPIRPYFSANSCDFISNLFLQSLLVENIWVIKQTSPLSWTILSIAKLFVCSNFSGGKLVRYRKEGSIGEQSDFCQVFMTVEADALELS